MKKTIIFLLLMGTVVPELLAQKGYIEENLEIPSNKKVELNLKFANDIKITAWDKDMVYVKVNYQINNGKLNDALTLSSVSDSESARVTMEIKEEIIKTGDRSDCIGDNTTGHYNNAQMQGVFFCSEINYEVFVPADVDLFVETINGNIEIRELTGTVEAKSISGFVDMDWPADLGAEVMLETITGEVYSDLDLNLSNLKKSKIVGHELKGSINNGGRTIKLNSISENIYFRSKE